MFDPGHTVYEIGHYMILKVQNAKNIYQTCLNNTS